MLPSNRQKVLCAREGLARLIKKHLSSLVNVVRVRGGGLGSIGDEESKHLLPSTAMEVGSS